MIFYGNGFGVMQTTGHSMMQQLFSIALVSEKVVPMSKLWPQSNSRPIPKRQRTGTGPRPGGHRLVPLLNGRLAISCP